MIQDVVVEIQLHNSKKKTAKGRSVSQKEYDVKKNFCFAKWTFEFPGPVLRQAKTKCDLSYMTSGQKS